MSVYTYKDSTHETIVFVTSYNKGGSAFDYNLATRVFNITDDINKSVTYYNTGGDYAVFAISYQGGFGAEVEKSMSVYTYKDSTHETIDFVTSYNKGGRAFDYNLATRVINITDDIKKSVTYYNTGGDYAVFAISYQGGFGAEAEKSMSVYTYKDSTQETIDFVTSYNKGGTSFD